MKGWARLHYHRQGDAIVGTDTMGFLRQHPEFLKLWSGQAVSSFGSRITTVAMPLAAVLVLHASPLQMGVLSALTVLPHLLFGLLAGVWVDRLSRRTMLIVADVARAVLLGSIPVLAMLDLLRLEHLYAVAFATGIRTRIARRAACRNRGARATGRQNGDWIRATATMPSACPARRDPP